ncbi:iron chelate uptake ABC transporter family permease subunit [Streptomyces sp. DSM 44917]|uniref:Iron chelate uptake ABC transporter family permease subunit n=1 Tax=Streptomyces boetiae TaxID=3075541 RepID=A0ABU2LFB1_9ACTN|nr:iron chelate uptake ABC transporter family permease subunit [Streptomyces sp. DSM 44917]MDT0310278.1 iron chelate uptake ABC transporter family permease subunit [Streptomyces sp. DSM 44917]
MSETPTAAPRAARGPVLRTRGGLSLRLHLRGALAGLLLAVLALAVAVLLIGTGDYAIPPGEVLRTLTGGGTAAQEFIVHELRLPRVLVALLVGLALGVSGAVFQAVSRNPLGSPDVVGFNQGSAAGALTVIVLLDGSTAAVAAGAVGGGLLTGLAVYLLAWRGGVHGYRLVLVGIGAAATLTAVNSYLLTRAEIVDAARAVLWLTGSLNGRDWGEFWPLLAACAVLLPLILTQGAPLRMLEMGDEAAGALGVRVERTRLLLVVAAVLLTAVATAAAGPIVFVALTAPQLARRLTRAPGPNLLPAALMGALLMAASDYLAQSAFPGRQLPVGAVTSVLGGAYLLWLLYTERRAGRV